MKNLSNGRFVRNDPHVSFHEKYTKDALTGCWNWRAKTARYGYFTIDARTILAHMASWTLFRGEIPKGMVICHHCDNIKCVNPDHLFVGTQKDNIRDCIAKGRRGFTAPKQPRRGTDNHAAKMTEDDVRQLRKVRSEWGLRYVDLGIIFGISAPVAHGIVQRKLWKHVA